MQRFCFYAPILALLLAGCISSANAQPKELIKNTPTNQPEKSIPTDTATPEIVPHDPPASCPITRPQNPPFTPPAPYDALGTKGYFWFGSSSLWTSLPQDGIWFSLPHNSTGYTQKLPWWREGYVWDEEPEPPLIVTGERLDAKAPPLDASRANGSYASDMGSAMMMGMDIPTLGCWKITGKYKDAELSFVIWVAP